MSHPLIEVKPTYARWTQGVRTVAEFVEQFAQRTPQMHYPDHNGFRVEMHADCGLGHRLLRNAHIYHSARLAGYAVEVAWFPWAELFNNTPLLCASDPKKPASFRFGNEPTEMEALAVTGREPSIVQYPNLAVSKSLQFEFQGCHQEIRWEREVFGPASCDHVAHFQLQLVSQLRDQWVHRLDKFLAEVVGNRRLIGLHVRTGNGESGDFVTKNRLQNVPAIVESFRNELSRYGDEDIAIFIASDAAEPATILKHYFPEVVVEFSESKPLTGHVVGDWVAPNSPASIIASGHALRIEQAFTAYADMLLLGMADDLYAAAWSSFLAGPCLMNRRCADLGTSFRFYDTNADAWNEA
jgi:hypothetical protein